MYILRKCVRNRINAGNALGVFEYYQKSVGDGCLRHVEVELDAVHGEEEEVLVGEGLVRDVELVLVAGGWQQRYHDRCGKILRYGQICMRYLRLARRAGSRYRECETQHRRDRSEIDKVLLFDVEKRT